VGDSSGSKYKDVRIINGL